MSAWMYRVTKNDHIKKRKTIQVVKEISVVASVTDYRRKLHAIAIELGADSVINTVYTGFNTYVGTAVITESIKSVVDNHGELWTSQEDEVLIQLYGEVDIKDIAKKIGRTDIALWYRIDKLGILNPEDKELFNNAKKRHGKNLYFKKIRYAKTKGASV